MRLFGPTSTSTFVLTVLGCTSCGSGSAVITSAFGNGSSQPVFFVASRIPSPDEKEVEPDVEISLTFSRPLAAPHDVTFLVERVQGDDSTEILLGSTIPEEDGRRLTFRSTVPLRLRGTYQVRLEGIPRDADGRTLEDGGEALSWAFHIRDGAFSGPEQVQLGDRVLKTSQVILNPEPSFAVVQSREIEVGGESTFDLLEYLIPERLTEKITTTPLRPQWVRYGVATTDRRVILWTEQQEGGNVPGVLRAAHTDGLPFSGNWLEPIELVLDMDSLPEHCGLLPEPVILSAAPDETIVLWRESNEIQARVATVFPGEADPQWKAVQPLPNTSEHRMPGSRTVFAAPLEADRFLVVWIEGPAFHDNPSGDWSLVHTVLARDEGEEAGWRFQTPTSSEDLSQPIHPRGLVSTSAGTLVFCGTDGGDGRMENGRPYARSYQRNEDSWSEPAQFAASVVGLRGDKVPGDSSGCIADTLAPGLKCLPGQGSHEVIAIFEGESLPNETMSLWALTLDAPEDANPLWATAEDILDHDFGEMRRVISLEVATDEEDGAVLVGCTIQTNPEGSPNDRTGRTRSAYLPPTPIGQSSSQPWQKISFDREGHRAILARMSGFHPIGQLRLAWTETDPEDAIFVAEFR